MMFPMPNMKKRIQKVTDNFSKWMKGLIQGEGLVTSIITLFTFGSDRTIGGGEIA